MAKTPTEENQAPKLFKTGRWPSVFETESALQALYRRLTQGMDNSATVVGATTAFSAKILDCIKAAKSYMDSEYDAEAMRAFMLEVADEFEAQIPDARAKIFAAIEKRRAVREAREESHREDEAESPDLAG